MASAPSATTLFARNARTSDCTPKKCDWKSDLGFVRLRRPFIILALKFPGAEWSARFHDEILEGLETTDNEKVNRAVQHDIEDTVAKKC